MDLELVCGADFSWKLMCGAGPGDLGGSRGSLSVENPWKSGPTISGQTAFRYLTICSISETNWELAGSCCCKLALRPMVRPPRLASQRCAPQKIARPDGPPDPTARPTRPPFKRPFKSPLKGPFGNSLKNPLKRPQGACCFLLLYEPDFHTLRCSRARGPTRPGAP